MYIKILIKGAILTSIMILGAYPGSLRAEESSSFKLYHEAFQYGERGPAESDSFKVNEDGTTWNAKPLTSNSFQIVTAPPTAAAAAPPHTTEEEEEEEETTPPSGGHRGHGTNQPDPSEPSEDDDPDKPAAPDEDDEDKIDDADVMDDTFSDMDFVPSDAKPIYDEGVGYPRGERRLAPLHYFYMTEPERIIVKEEVLSHQAAEMIEQSRNIQIALMFTQAISALCFLLAFQLLLSRVPYKFLKK